MREREHKEYRREGERKGERIRKKKDAREGDVMVESSDEMPREKRGGGWELEKTAGKPGLHFLRQ